MSAPRRSPDETPPPSHDLDRESLDYQLALKNRALASAVEGITISDLRLPDNPLVYVNRGFTEITGYSREESIGRNCRYLQGPDTDPAAISEIREAIADRRSCVVEILNYRHDGSPFWNRLSVTPLRDGSGEVTHYIGVQSDVTEERNAKDALRETKERLERAHGHMQRDLLAAASIQRSLLPDKVPTHDRASFAWHLDSCDELAGDTLNIFELDEDHIGMYVVDVPAHRRSGRFGAGPGTGRRGSSAQR
jgi:PAS domain S-box-containing protein